MMKTKTYYAKELPTALDQIKNELGPDAAIVRSRKARRPGIKGLFSKPVYEIVVSYDPDELERSKRKERPYKRGVQEPLPLGQRKGAEAKPNEEVLKMAAKASRDAQKKVRYPRAPQELPESAQEAEEAAEEAARAALGMELDAEPEESDGELLDADFLADEAEDVITESLYTDEDLEIAALLQEEREKEEAVSAGVDELGFGRVNAYQIVQGMVENKDRQKARAEAEAKAEAERKRRAQEEARKRERLEAERKRRAREEAERRAREEAERREKEEAERRAREEAERRAKEEAERRAKEEAERREKEEAERRRQEEAAAAAQAAPIEKEDFPRLAGAATAARATAAKAGGKKKAPKPARIIKEAAAAAIAQEAQEAPRAKAAKAEEAGDMDARLRSMEAMLKSLAEDMRRINGAGAEEARQAAEEAQQGAPAPRAAEEARDMGLEALRLRLLDQDVDSMAVQGLVERAGAILEKEGAATSADRAMRKAIAEMLGRPKYLQSSTKGTRVVMLMGPTGVGKTTTVAKLAASCVFSRRVKAGLINADVFRVGAQEQLATYADILESPFATIHSAAELKKALAGMEECRYVFIDTAGHASADSKYQDEIAEIINLGCIHEIYLVTSGTTSARMCRQIASDYSFVKKYKNILTKIDEAGSYGNALTLGYYGKQPLAYFTIGQNVPEDIRRVDMDVLIDMLLRISR